MSEDKRKYNNAFEATLSGIADLFKKRENIDGLSKGERLDGKTVLITGASSGLGYATAEQLASRGARLILACRSGIPEKGEEIINRTGNTNVSMIHVDLSDLDSIDALVGELSNNAELIDVLICNAAMVPGGSRRSPQGLEEMFVVNYLSKFYLINKVMSLDLLTKSSGGWPRIIVVSSESHRNPEGFEWEKFGVYEEYGMKSVIHRYGYFKLLLTTFTRELARRLNSEGKVAIPVRSLCPGPVNSNIAREAPKVFTPLLKLVFGIFFKSAKTACEPVVYYAATSNVEKSFDYLFLMSRQPIDPLADDPENGQMLWDHSEAILKSLGREMEVV